ncbi:MAG: decaprenyl-phosphate phosphoribosyltransferase [Planctomycetota bacterium]
MSPTALVLALRPQQWIKNVFVFAALVFARGERGGWVDGDYSDIRRTLFAFFAFCLGSSAVYLVNDVADIESDRKHPTKRDRPIAAGALSIPVAIAAAVACAAGALWFAHVASPSMDTVAWVVAAYILLNLSYSFRLKHVVLVDAFCIAGGFLMRVYAGGLAAGAFVSHWLMLCTLFLSLFLALCKRRAESDLLGEGRGEHRAILLEYNSGFLDQMITVVAACTIITYSMYTVSDDTARKFGASHSLIWSVPFVVFGVARYMLLVQKREGGGNPARVLLGGDLLFAMNAVAWAAVVVIVLFLRHASPA